MERFLSRLRNLCRPRTRIDQQQVQATPQIEGRSPLTFSDLSRRAQERLIQAEGDPRFRPAGWEDMTRHEREEALDPEYGAAYQTMLRRRSNIVGFK